MESHTSLRLIYPEHLERWKPLYKWFLAVPQYFVLVALFVAACVGIVVGSFAVLVTGQYPEVIRGFLVDAYRYALVSRPTSASSPIGTRRSALPPERTSPMSELKMTRNGAPNRSRLQTAALSQSGRSPAGHSCERSSQTHGCCAVPLAKGRDARSCRPRAHAPSTKCPKTRGRLRADA